MGILSVTGQLTEPGKLRDYTFAGELGLDGGIYPIRGALSMAIAARKGGNKGILLPCQNASEAYLIKGLEVYGISHFKQAVEFIQCDVSLEPFICPQSATSPVNTLLPDLAEVRGQRHVKRALEIAAAGGHHTLMIGPPGSGKTMLARRLPSILPPMTETERLETMQIYSVAGKNPGHENHLFPMQRPFRHPHHHITEEALAGGGMHVLPGEMTLAHNGVLFLDEFSELKQSAIETLRQPLEERRITIARAKVTLEYPAAFMLIAAMNSCLCGYYNHPTRKCTCSKRALYWFRRKISGPILERFDLQVEVEPVLVDELAHSSEVAESSATVRERVIRARAIQRHRFETNHGIYCNAMMEDRDLGQFCPLEEKASCFLLKKLKEQDYSARAYACVLKVARTIADLAGHETIELQHIAEALYYRSLDKPPAGNQSVKVKPFEPLTYPFAV